MADNEELFNCSICLQLLEDPVTIPCGHNYCMKCIKTFWDKTKNTVTYSCPQCRETFHTRPVLKKNTLLADLLEQHKQKNSENAADDDTCAAPGDVHCDACTGRKRKASMFCLVCLASYCEAHLQPHLEVPPLQKHSLVPASARIKENVCSQHNKLLEVYCRTDQQFICLMCMMSEHKDHDTVAAAAEKSEMERRLKRTKEEITKQVQNSNRKVAKLKEAADSIRDAAWEACDDFEQLCDEHIRTYVHYVQRKRSEMREKVGEVEKAGVDWTNDRIRRLQREVFNLKKSEDKLDQLSLIDDPIQFFKGFLTLGGLPKLPNTDDRGDTLMVFVAEQKGKLKNLCNTEKNGLFNPFDKTLVSKIPREELQIESRECFLLTHRKPKVEVDPCTVAACLCLSNSNRQILWSERDQGHPDHPDRFSYFYQALSKEGLTGNHYWEVEWDGGIVELAVSYKGIKRKGSGGECCFGHNNVSWKLTCSSSGCTFWHDNLHKGQIPPVQSRRVGVHLDHEAGRLRFYSVSQLYNLTLLHQIQTTFTEALYPGFSVDLGATLEICNI